MKTVPFVLPAVALLVVACSDSTSPNLTWSAQSGGLLASNSGGAVVHRVSVGGADQDPINHSDANFSLIAIQRSDGSVQGEWTDQFGQGEGGVHVDVNCLLVVGNQAWIGGVIQSDNIPGVDLTGVPALTRVADLGASANDPPDVISFTFIGLAVPCTAAPNLPLIPMSDGQVTVN